MNIDIRFDEGVTFLAVDGEVDAATADQLCHAALAELTDACSTLRIDLAGVSFIDSSGVAALIAIRNAADTSHAVVIDNPRPQARRIFEISGLAEPFGVRIDHLSATAS